MQGYRRGTGGPDPPPPPEKSRKYRFLSNSSPNPLKNHKATKPTFNVGPSLARQRNAIEMVFCWWANDDGPVLVVFGSPQKKKKLIVGPPLKKLSGFAHETGKIL